MNLYQLGLVFALGLVACSSDSNSGAVDAQVADQKVIKDTAAADSTVDAGIEPDTMTPDTMTPDTMTPDTMTPDTMTPDTIAADTIAADSTTGSPCAGGATLVGQQSGVAGCAAPSSGVDQCQAAALCNLAGGWRICPASVYQASFGGSAPPLAFDTMWLGACVRDDDVAKAPTDQICSDCTVGLIGGEIVGYFCDGSGLPQSMNAYSKIGLLTNTFCVRAGLDDGANAAFWLAKEVSHSAAGALCCGQP